MIVLVQENRSFVNLFMGYPGADAPTEGACKPNPALKLCLDGKPVRLKEITLETTGLLGGKDIGHDHAVFETEFDGGKMDGFNDIPLGTAGNLRSGEALPVCIRRKERDEAILELGERLYARRPNVLDGNVRQFRGAPANHCRHDAPQRARIARRHSQRHAVGLRRSYRHDGAGHQG